ncbi:MAG: cytochrome P450 [Gammaproteobacteria bacterium]|nr:cytochrome P450 [Gammaproteobacteria bacterium]
MATSRPAPSNALPPLADDAFDVGATPDSLERLQAAAATNGDIFRVRMPGRRADAWILNNAEDIRQVLLHHHERYAKGLGLIDRVALLLGNGIIVSHGALWKRQRRMIQPAFSRHAHATFAQLIGTRLDAELQAWRRCAAAGASLEITGALSRMALDIVLRALFSSDLDGLCQRAGGNPFAMIVDDPARDLKFAYRFRSLGRLVADLARQRATDAEPRSDILGALVAGRDRESGAAMSERQLIDEVMTMIIAGHETSATALNFTWYLLSRHPEAERRLHAEVDALPDSVVVSFEEARELRYTRAVIEESMRLYPPVWLLTRRALQSDTLSGYTLPAGTDVMFSPYLLHRHPRYWQAPEAFRPERFLADDPRQRHVYIPFGAGPRRCLGEEFSLYEMSVHVARSARHLLVRPADDEPMQLEAAINLRTRRPLRMRLLPRRC